MIALAGRDVTSVNMAATIRRHVETKYAGAVNAGRRDWVDARVVWEELWQKGVRAKQQYVYQVIYKMFRCYHRQEGQQIPPVPSAMPFMKVTALQIALVKAIDSLQQVYHELHNGN